MIFKAIEFAAKAHSGQYRKASDLPYIIHPLRVAQILIEHDCPNDVVVAGILHDTVEDTDVTLDDIRTEFGNGVAGLVAGASETNRRDSWENRKKQMLRELREVGSQDLLILVCADKLDNIRAIRHDLSRIGETVWERFNRSKEKQHWYFKSMFELFCDKLNGQPGRTLCHKLGKEIEIVFGD